MAGVRSAREEQLIAGNGEERNGRRYEPQRDDEASRACSSGGCTCSDKHSGTESCPGSDVPAVREPLHVKRTVLLAVVVQWRLVRLICIQ